ncbi:McrB family protein [Intrasporangium sp. YIM S08009]|uniref:McrB family protein n=1 Tax=Intrasporangium zincisolvens TaxID=3080018 RepID=UPI002B057F1B|nr:AAA family ATPase [Intrasporangium sp. YIM S08009]
MSNELATRILEAFEDSPNVLLVGPPGTGKTVAMDLVAALYRPGASATVATFNPNMLHGGFGQQGFQLGQHRRYASLLFHPSYSYEHFVMGLLPDLQGNNVIVKPHVGPLLELAQYASQPDHEALIVLDEFNRGNAAAIFGDTLGLLDKDKRDSAFVETPFHHLSPATSSGPLGPTVTMPSTLRILAAMNSADRSVAPIDAALRRRFAIIHVDPDLNALGVHLGADRSGGYVAADPRTWTKPEHIYALAVDILEALNSRIEFILGRDFLIGQSAFWHVAGNDVDEALKSLASALDNRVLGTLSLTFTDDDDALAAVLNVGESGGSAAAKWEEPTGAMSRWAKRLRVSRFAQHADPRAALLSLLNISVQPSAALGSPPLAVPVSGAASSLLEPSTGAAPPAAPDPDSTAVTPGEDDNQDDAEVEGATE